MTVAAALQSISAGGWIDLISIVFLGISILLGAIRGISGQIARVCGFVSGLASISLLRGPIHASVFGSAPGSGIVLSLSLSIVAGVVIALIVRAAVARFLRLVVSQPCDAVIGAAVSAAVCAVLLSIVLSVVGRLPLGVLSEAATTGSYAGRTAAPVAARLFGFSQEEQR